jgi:dihydrofolate reductase
MEGGTTFHFVTGGIHAALERAVEAAQGKDVRVGGGSATIQQYLRAGLIDEMHLAIAPVLLGAGELLFAGVNLRELGYECREFVPGTNVNHVVVVRSSASR